jgi:hypothetical protein
MRIAQSKPSERRRSPREGHIIEGFLSPYNSKDRVEMINFDLSRHGVSFDANCEVPVGAHYIYEIGFGPQTMVCDIRIVSCKRLGSDIWHMGAEFI